MPREELVVLLVQPLSLHVQPQDADVERDDAGEKRGDDDDPDDAPGQPRARRGPLPRRRAGLGARAWLRARRSARAGLRPCGCSRHQVFTATRSRADEARGFSAVSAGEGLTALRVASRSDGSLPHTQIGRSGGHVQPRASAAKKRLTILSSSEWKLMTAIRPPGRSRRTAAGSACSSDSSSSLTTMRSAWKTRFAGWPSPKRRGAGIAERTTSTRSPVRSNGCSSRRRTIARAICREKRSSP